MNIAYFKHNGRQLLGYFALWSALGLIFSLYTYFTQQIFGRRAADLTHALQIGMTTWYLTGLLTPFILEFTNRFRIERENLLSRVLVHVGAGIAFSVLHSILLFGFLWMINIDMLHRPGKFIMMIVRHGSFDFMVYCAIVSVAHALDFYRKLRERELRASKLQTQLATAQLQALRNQLHPHFLFNTLHAISSLIYEDVRAADTMIRKLSDLLRLNLESSALQKAPLSKELEFLDLYLDIMKTRFQDRLTVSFAIDPETLEAVVPYLILQPLVENALRHGIESKAGPGTVIISARRTDATLELIVEDDGIGLPDGASNIIMGVGLRNTIERLEQLYGDAGSFTIDSRDQGGVRAVIALPFESSNNAEPNKRDDIVEG